MKNLDYFIDLLKKNNIAITSSRLTILKVLNESDGHLEIEDIFNRVKEIDNKIGLATIYRTLNLFCELSIITKHEFEGYKTIYEKSDTYSKHHHHIIDINDSKIIEFIDNEIDEVLRRICDKYGYRMISHKVEIYGEKNDRRRCN